MRKGVNLERRRDDFYLLSEIPLIAIKVNQTLYDILCEMGRSNSISCFPEKDRQLIDLLDKLVMKGMLTKDEIVETLTYPTLSVIVPVKNRPQDIQECITSLGFLDYPRDKLEIIVVDDGSTDSTFEVIQAFKIKAIRLTQSIGASGCRNLAAKEANGDLIGFTDSDCVPHPHWLRDLSPYFDEEKIGIVGGYVSNFYNRSSLDRYEEVKSSLNMGAVPFRAKEDPLSHFYVPSCNLIIRKKAFFEAGGFEENLKVGEDVDLCWRVRELGYHLIYVPQGMVRHKHRNDLPHMLARRYDYGTSEAILYLRHREKRKRLYLSPLYSTFYGSLCIGFLFQYPLLFLIGLGTFSIDYFRKYIHLRKYRLSLGSSKLFFSVLRSHITFSYFTSSYLVRYYLIFFIFLSFFHAEILGFLFILLVFTAIVEFSVNRPRILFPFFLFFYTLDHLAYQIGVLSGCMKKKNFMPYIPLILRKFKK